MLSRVAIRKALLVCPPKLKNIQQVKRYYNKAGFSRNVMNKLNKRIVNRLNMIKPNLGDNILDKLSLYHSYIMRYKLMMENFYERLIYEYIPYSRAAYLTALEKTGHKSLFDLLKTKWNGIIKSTCSELCAQKKLIGKKLKTLSPPPLYTKGSCTVYKEPNTSAIHYTAKYEIYDKNKHTTIIDAIDPSSSSSSPLPATPLSESLSELKKDDLVHKNMLADKDIEELQLNHENAIDVTGKEFKLNDSENDRKNDVVHGVVLDIGRRNKEITLTISTAQSNDTERNILRKSLSANVNFDAIPNENFANGINCNNDGSLLNSLPVESISMKNENNSSPSPSELEKFPPANETTVEKSKCTKEQ